MGENEKKILILISNNPLITINELAKRVNISTTAIENNIKKLKSKKLLIRIGPAKGGHWEILE